MLIHRSIVIFGITALGCAAESGKPPSYRGKTVDEWYSSFKNEKYSLALLNLNDLRAFWEMGEAAVPYLVEELKFEDPRFKPHHPAEKALVALGYLAVPGLLKALGDDDPEVRYRACRAFRNMGIEALEAVPALACLVDDPNEDVRRMACMAIAFIITEEAFDSNAMPSARVNSTHKPIPREHLILAYRQNLILGTIVLTQNLNRLDDCTASGIEAMLQRLQDPKNRYQLLSQK